MKPTTFLVSALATMVAAAPAAEKKVEERAFSFDANVFGGFNKFNQVNLDYLLNINNLNLGLLQQLAVQNNFNINPFANLFQLQAGQFAIQDVLLLQQLSDLLFFANAGVLNQFDLAQFQFGGILNTGLLNLGGISLNPFIDQLGSNVITQVQTVASQVLPGFNGINGGILGGGISGGLNSGLTSGISFPGVSSGVSSDAVVSSAPSTGAVTAAEQEAQEGGSSLNRA